MSFSPPEVTNQCTVCTLWEHGLALQDLLKLQVRASSAAAEKSTFWLTTSEQTIPKKPCSQTAVAMSAGGAGKKVVFQIPKFDNPRVNQEDLLVGVLQHPGILSRARRH